MRATTESKRPPRMRAYVGGVAASSEKLSVWTGPPTSSRLMRSVRGLAVGEKIQRELESAGEREQLVQRRVEQGVAVGGGERGGGGSRCGGQEALEIDGREVRQGTFRSRRLGAVAHAAVQVAAAADNGDVEETRQTKEGRVLAHPVERVPVCRNEVGERFEIGAAQDAARPKQVEQTAEYRRAVGLAVQLVLEAGGQRRGLGAQLGELRGGTDGRLTGRAGGGITR